MEETKFGLDEEELNELISTLPGLPNIALKGLMGMASFTDDDDIVRNEFRRLKALYEKINVLYAAQFPGSQLTTLSMGMSADYRIAIEEGSNMIRIGSLLFGVRN